MSYLSIELVWIGALLIGGVAFSASTVVAYITSQMSGEVRKGLLLLSIAAFFGSTGITFPATLQLLHVPVTDRLWMVQVAVFLASGLAYAPATYYFSETALQLNRLSEGEGSL